MDELWGGGPPGPPLYLRHCVSCAFSFTVIRKIVTYSSAAVNANRFVRRFV